VGCAWNNYQCTRPPGRPAGSVFPSLYEHDSNGSPGVQGRLQGLDVKKPKGRIVAGCRSHGMSRERDSANRGGLEASSPERTLVMGAVGQPAPRRASGRRRADRLLRRPSPDRAIPPVQVGPAGCDVLAGEPGVEADFRGRELAAYSFICSPR